MIQSTVLSLLSLGLWKVEPQDEESVVQPSFSLHGSGNQRETQRSQGTNIHLENKVQRPKFLLVPPHVLKVPQLPKRTPLWTPSLNTQDFRGKESSTSLVIRELQIKTILGFHLKPERVTFHTIKDVEFEEHSTLLVGVQNCTATMETSPIQGRILDTEK